MNSDTDLRADVTEALLRDPMVTAGETNIACRHGVVTGIGTVPNFAEKRAAEHTAQRVTATVGKVTLSESIRSWDQRQEAGSAAWRTFGVTEVEKNLPVSP